MSKPRKPRILVIEPDRKVIAVLHDLFLGAGFVVDSVGSSDLALQRIEEDRPDLIITEWRLAELSGLALCRRIRRDPELRSLPIVMLTDRNGDDERARGLEAGADDFVAKPFYPRELVARVRNVMRRACPALFGVSLSYHDIEMDPESRRVTRAGRAIHLRPKEFRLLQVLLEAPQRVFTRQQLATAIWGYDQPADERTIDIHIRRLRVALGGEAASDHLRTVRGIGYGLAPEAGRQAF